MKIKYAIKVLFTDSWLQVSEGPIDNLRVMTLETLEEAQEWKKIWVKEGHEERVEIVEYDCGNLD